jgi:hypothetical protein
MKREQIPTKITLDAYAAIHRAVAELKARGELLHRVRVREQPVPKTTSSKPDRRRVKQRLRPMLGRKSFHTVAVVIGGVEPAEKIKKRTVQIGNLVGERQLCRRFGKLPWLHNRNGSGANSRFQTVSDSTRWKCSSVDGFGTIPQRSIRTGCMRGVHKPAICDRKTRRWGARFRLRFRMRS